MELINQFQNLLNCLLLDDIEYLYKLHKNILNNTKVIIKLKNLKKKF